MERPTPFADVVFHGCEPNRGLPFWAAEPHTKEPVMDEGTPYVGMDVHKRTIAVSIRFSDGTRDERTIPHETRAVNRLVRKMKREASGTIACAYEAGPCGYGLQRDLREQGLDCPVIAPSRIPRKPGDRIKTDRRDARKLAEWLEGGLLTEVHPPSPEDEAVRDLCRAREDAKEDEVRARHLQSRIGVSVYEFTMGSGMARPERTSAISPRGVLILSSK